MSLVQDTLFAAAEPANDACDLHKLAHWITQGKPVEIRPDMLVWQLNELWLFLWERGRDCGRKFNAAAKRFEQRKKVTKSQTEKERLHELAQRAESAAGMAIMIAERSFTMAQERFSERWSDDFHDIFWVDVMSRPGTELTWKMTLQQVIDVLEGKQTPPTNEKEISAGNIQEDEDGSPEPFPHHDKE